jgi:hypothetical protein
LCRLEAFSVSKVHAAITIPSQDRYFKEGF